METGNESDEVKQLYEALGVPHKPLTLVRPQFVDTGPNLKPAWFPPVVKELPPPPLERFNFRDHTINEELLWPGQELSDDAADSTQVML